MNPDIPSNDISEIRQSGGSQNDYSDPAIHRSQVKRNYDLLGEEYYQRRRNTATGQLLNDFLERLPDSALVLDAGCGPGIPITKAIAQRYTVFGVDFSESQLQIAREHVPSADFLCADLTSLPFPNNTFDGISMFFTLFHIPREEHEGLLEDFYHTLTAGGYLLFDAGRRDCFRKQDPNWLDTGVKMQWSQFDAPTYETLLKEIGYTVIWQRDMDHSLAGDEIRHHPFILAQK